MVECKQLNVSIILFIASVIAIIFSILKLAKCNTKAMQPRHIKL